MPTVPTRVLFTRRLDELPERIRAVIGGGMAGSFSVALKTAYRPSFTIPSIWLVLTSEGFLLCNTHSTRGLWRKYSRSDLPSLRIESTFTGQPCVEIEGASMEALVLPLQKAIPRDQLDEFIAEYKRLKG